MNFLADESVDRQIAVSLREAGRHVVYIAEIDPSIDDSEVFDLANESRCLLITADKDFGELVFRDGRLLSDGVVLIRLAGLSPSRKAEVVQNALNENESTLLERFSVISPGRFRSRSKD